MESEYDVIVAFITTKLKWKKESDILILPSKENGLKEFSLVRLTKLATIDKELIVGRLGEITKTEVKQINKNLITLLSLDEIIET